MLTANELRLRSHMTCRSLRTSRCTLIEELVREKVGLTWDDGAGHVEDVEGAALLYAPVGVLEPPSVPHALVKGAVDASVVPVGEFEEAGVGSPGGGRGGGGGREARRQRHDHEQSRRPQQEGGRKGRGGEGAEGGGGRGGPC